MRKTFWFKIHDERKKAGLVLKLNGIAVGLLKNRNLKSAMFSSGEALSRTE